MSAWVASSRRVALVAASLVLAGCVAAGPPQAPVAEVTSTPPVVADAQPAQPATDAAPRAPEAAPPTSRNFETARAGLAVSTPRGWKVKRRERALVYEAPMRVPSVALFEPSRQSLDAVVTGLDKELAAPLGRVRITKAARETELAGYRAFVAEGTGTAEGFPMRWRATVIEARHLTVVLALTPTFFWGMNQGAIRSFERGVRRADMETAALRQPEVAVR